MSDKLERLARVAIEAMPEWCAFDPQAELEVPNMVRAILRELREPTEEMRKHMYQGPVVSWQAVIDSLLEDCHDR